MRALFFSVLLFATTVARAHDPGLSSLVVTPGSGGLEVVATFAPADVAPLADPANPAALAALAPAVVTLRAGDVSVPPVEAVAAHDAAGSNVEFRLRFPPTDGPLTLDGDLLERLPAGHRQLAVVRDAAGVVVTEQLLRADAALLALPSSSSSSSSSYSPPTFLGWVWLGVEHILIGYDHLLFLAALLLVARGFADAVKIITCFTIAHSLTLALATLGIVNLPGRFVETVIPVSIVYVAVENIVTRGRPRLRYLVTFAFGLIHGLGFASVLAGLGIGQAGVGIVAPLLGFNLGVEAGQVAVAALVLPLFAALRRHPVWLERGIPAGSAVLALAGGWWLVERLAGA